MVSLATLNIFLFARGFTILYGCPLGSWGTLAILNNVVVKVILAVQHLI